MTIIKEVADGIKLVADGIENVRNIYSSINDSRAYLEMKHPDVRDDVAAMCVEMRKTLQAIAAASSIITHFKFNVSSQEIAHEPTRFNDYFIEHKVQARNVQNQISSLRGHCSKIQEHAERLEDKAQKARLANMFKLFGFDTKEREQKLADGLAYVYDEESQIHAAVWNLGWIVTLSLDEINKKLGPPGVMDAKNVPAAAKLLGEYAEVFSELEANANFAALQLQRLVDELIER
jgi:hypothetical protein